MSKPITVGFSTTTKFMSGVIRAVTGSPCSHTWFSYYERVEGAQAPVCKIAEAEWFSYRTIPRHRWETKNKQIAEFELIGPPATESVAHMVNSYSGANYDYFAAALVGTKKYLGRWIKGKFRDPKKLMCSEGVLKMLYYAGYNELQDLDPETTSPKELMISCYRHPEHFKLLRAAPGVEQWILDRLNR